MIPWTPLGNDFPASPPKKNIVLEHFNFEICSKLKCSGDCEAGARKRAAQRAFSSGRFGLNVYDKSGF